MLDDFSAFFGPLREVSLTDAERGENRAHLQQFMRAHRAADGSTLDRTALELSASGLSVEEKHVINTALQTFMHRPRSAQPATQSDSTVLPLFFGAWQGGNLLRHFEPFSVSTTSR